MLGKEAHEDSYINMKEYAENVHDPKHEIYPLAKTFRLGPPLFKSLDGSRRVYKVDDIHYKAGKDLS